MRTSREILAEIKAIQPTMRGSDEIRTQTFERFKRLSELLVELGEALVYEHGNDAAS